MTNNNKKNSSGLSAVDLASLRALQPGTLVDLQISTPTSPKRVKTQYVGMDYPRCMVFQFPNMNKYGVLKDVLYPENTVIVRYVLEGDSGQVIAFKAKINHIQSQPSNLFFTTVPKALQSLGLRSEKRTSPGIAAEITVGEDGEAVKSVIVDVSQSGCRVLLDQTHFDDTSAEDLAVETEVTLCIDLSDKTIILKGVIKNLKKDAGHLYMGIQFDSSNSDVDVLLERHIITV
ncbi:PilZ domain-containing protein [Alteromonas sp. ASW11-36]|uniref:PilZ domain-containing protein n=1 Tax=Alteromonas arenosi TaxID=3055817 RepID=A0ABT7SXW8_9ALTE|nr:PilZ domain-containing protein [Alteromonas sp. ASW11-36]